MTAFSRRRCFVLALAGLLGASLLPAQYTYENHFGDVEATLTVETAKKAPQSGTGEVILTLRVTGPATLEVEPPRLGDAAAAWKEQRQNSTRQPDKDKVQWRQVIRLLQVKPGVEPLPDVTVRFRRTPDADWTEAKWINILQGVHDHTRPPAPPPEEPSWLRRWGFVLILAATLLLIVLAWLMRRRRQRRAAPLPADQWALRELDRIERTLLPPRSEAETYHTQLSYVVRRYLAERFGLQALQQTTAEFLEALRSVPRVSAAQQNVLHKSSFQGNARDLGPQLTEQQQTLLANLFQRCDLAKFAHVEVSEEECRQAAGLARELIRQTTPPG